MKYIKKVSVAPITEPEGAVIDSLSGSSTTNAPSIRAVNEALSKERDIMTASISADITLTFSSAWQTKEITLNVTPFKSGNKLSLENGGIKIGTGISKILVAGIQSLTNFKNTGDIVCMIKKNSQTICQINHYVGNTYNQDVAIPLKAINVQEGDIIKLAIMFPTAEQTLKVVSTYETGTYLTVQAI